MTRTEDRLADLLRQAVADQVDGVSLEQVARRARRARRTAIASATLAVALLAGAAIAAAAPSAPGHPRPAAISSQERQRRLAFEGVVVTLPAGWRTATWRPCGWPANHTVVTSDHINPRELLHQCATSLLPEPLPTSLTLISIFSPTYTSSWTGRRVTWRDQPAWLSVNRARITTVGLVLPWLNVVATAQSPDPARARALLGLISVRTRPGLAVPASASSVLIQSLDGRSPHATITAAAQVRRILADLRALRPVRFRPACYRSSWWQDTAQLTVRAPDGSARTYAAVFGSCDEVVAGTGTAAGASRRLLTDIRRLVPKSGL